MAAKDPWSRGKFVYIQVCNNESTARTLRDGINERSNEEEARVFKRMVRAGRASTPVYVLVVRQNAAHS